MKPPKPTAPGPHAITAIRASYEDTKAEMVSVEFEIQQGFERLEKLERARKALAEVLTLWGASPEPVPPVDPATEHLALSIAIETVLRDESPLTHEALRTRLVEMGVDAERFGPGLRQYFKTVARLEKRKRVERTASGRLKIGPKSLVA